MNKLEEEMEYCDDCGYVQVGMIATMIAIGMIAIGLIIFKLSI